MHLPTSSRPTRTTPRLSHSGFLHARKNAGHSLIEICLALTVSAALVTMSATAVDELIGARVVEGAAAEFAQDIQYARAQSVALNRNVSIAFRNSAANAPGCYTLYTGIAGSCTCHASGESACTDGSMPIKTVVVPPAHGVTMLANVTRMHIESGRGLIVPAGVMTVAARDHLVLKQTVNIVGRVKTCSFAGPLSGYQRC